MSAFASGLRCARSYAPRDPTKTALYGLVRQQLATFREVTAAQGGVPEFVHEGFTRRLSFTPACYAADDGVH